jgi:hypothetical protein
MFSIQNGMRQTTYSVVCHDASGSQYNNISLQAKNALMVELSEILEILRDRAINDSDFEIREFATEELKRLDSK